MADSQVVSVKERPGWTQRLKRLVVPILILLMAAGILFLTAGNWNTWASDRPSQKTDDAYIRADLTPLSTKVAGLVASVAVSDYQPVKAGDLLVQLQDDDFRAQVQQAEAAVTAGEDALVNNQRQKELQDSRVVQAGDGIGPRKRISLRRRPASRRPNPLLSIPRAQSKEPRRTSNGQLWNAAGRRPWLPRRPRRVRNWNRRSPMRSAFARSSPVAKQT